MKHIIAYEGLVKVSLGLLQKEYGELYVPAANRRTGIDGTYQRAPYSFSDFDAFVAKQSENRGVNEVFAMLLHGEEDGKRTYRYIGHMGVHNIKWPDAIGSTGSIMSDVGSQSAGCGTEAKLLLQYHAFNVLGLRNLRSTVKAWNAKSLGHLIKCGYRVVGRYEKSIFHEGIWVDEFVLQCSRESWEVVWATYQDTKQLPTLTKEQRALVETETSST